MSKVRIVIIIVAVIAGIFSAARRNHTAPGVVSVKPKDPRMAAAIKEALDRWPEFEAAFNEHKPGRACEVKYGFRIREDGGGTEFIWVDVASISGTKITGTIDNDPAYDIGHKLGDTVTINIPEIADWMYADKDGPMVGGFSEQVLYQIEAEQKKR